MGWKFCDLFGWMRVIQIVLSHSEKPYIQMTGTSYFYHLFFSSKLLMFCQKSLICNSLSPALNGTCCTFLIITLWLHSYTAGKITSQISFVIRPVPHSCLVLILLSKCVVKNLLGCPPHSEVVMHLFLDSKKPVYCPSVNSVSDRVLLKCLLVLHIIKFIHDKEVEVRGLNLIRKAFCLLSNNNNKWLYKKLLCTSCLQIRKGYHLNR